MHRHAGVTVGWASAVAAMLASTRRTHPRRAHACAHTPCGGTFVQPCRRDASSCSRLLFSRATSMLLLLVLLASLAALKLPARRPAAGGSSPGCGASQPALAAVSHCSTRASSRDDRDSGVSGCPSLVTLQLLLACEELLLWRRCWCVAPPSRPAHAMMRAWLLNRARAQACRQQLRRHETNHAPGTAGRPGHGYRSSCAGAGLTAAGCAAAAATWPSSCWMPLSLNALRTGACAASQALLGAVPPPPAASGGLNLHMHNSNSGVAPLLRGRCRCTCCAHKPADPQPDAAASCWTSSPWRPGCRRASSRSSCASTALQLLLRRCVVQLVLQAWWLSPGSQA